MTDFFISYNQRDRTWAEWIAWALEESGYSVVIQAWDFRPGGNFVLDMQRAASQTERTIAVLSENYLNSQFTQPEWAAAFAQDPTGEKRSLIPIRVGECNLTGMWTTIVYVDLVGVEEAAAKALVLKAVQEGRTKPSQKPQFPKSQTNLVRPSFPTQIPANLPLSGATQFVGRKADLANLHEQLQQGDPNSISAIAGMGGIGKTELALQYALEHRADYPGGICWLKAREEIDTQIVSFARSHLNLSVPEEAELAEQIVWCWQHWPPETALLVFDDVQQFKDIQPFLPPQRSQFKVLLTTRLQMRSPVSNCEINVLSEAQSLELLRASIQDERIDQELATAKQVCEWLGYLPLGLELVGRYLAKKQDVSIAELWKRLQGQTLSARALLEAEPGMTATTGVTAAFEVSWQALKPEAQRLAALLSLLALAEIPWRLVSVCLPQEDTEYLEDLRDDQLLGLSLLERTGQGRYRLHQLLREFFAVQCRQRPDRTELEQRVWDGVLAEADKSSRRPDRSLFEETSLAIPHLQAATDRWKAAGKSLDWAIGLSWLAALYKSQGRYTEAEPLYLQSLTIHEQQLGLNHPDVAVSLNNLAALYREQGRYTEAEPLYLRALSIHEQQTESSHSNVAQSLNNLAVLYKWQGRYQEAENLYQRSLSIREQQLPPDHPDIAQSLNNLAALYRRQGRYAEAEPLYIRSFAIYEQQLSSDHPTIAQSLHNLAALYREQGRFAEAEPLYLRALLIRERQFGPHHPDVAESLWNLAALYYRLERLTEAKPLIARAVEIFEAALGDQHPETLDARQLQQTINLH